MILINLISMLKSDKIFDAIADRVEEFFLSVIYMSIGCSVFIISSKSYPEKWQKKYQANLLCWRPRASWLNVVWRERQLCWICNTFWVITCWCINKTYIILCNNLITLPSFICQDESILRNFAKNSYFLFMMKDVRCKMCV